MIGDCLRSSFRRDGDGPNGSMLGFPPDGTIMGVSPTARSNYGCILKIKVEIESVLLLQPPQYPPYPPYLPPPSVGPPGFQGIGGGSRFAIVK